MESFKMIPEASVSYSKVKSLIPADYPNWVQFAEWYLNKINNETTFVKYIYGQTRHVLLKIATLILTIVAFGAKENIMLFESYIIKENFLLIFGLGLSIIL